MSGSDRGKRPPSEGGFLVAKAHQIGGRVFARMLKESSSAAINPAQGRILFALWKSGDMSVGELSKETALEPSTLTSMLDRLEAAGLLRREASKDDRRVVMIERTEACLALEEEYGEASTRMTELFYRGMGAEEIAAFEASLRKIVANLTEAEGDQMR
jgi:MarR family transcriptional regulator, organic hydroperoxide resistance regulator